jgi:predicted  nucleic acid-binding Zn-ribbon protein
LKQEAELVGIEAQIESLEQLAALDADVKELSAKLEAQRAEYVALKAAHAALERSLGADRAGLVEMERTRSELQIDHRNIVQQLDRSRDRVQRSRNEREVQAAERELDELRRLQRDRDDELSKMIGLCDQARNAIDDNELKLAELQEKLSSSEQGTLAQIHQLEAEVSAKKSGRASLLAKLPSLTGRRYESMHGRGKVPVAHTTDGTCRGCYVQLPPMLFHSLLSRTQFGECPFCHRIIWYAAPAAAVSTDAVPTEAAMPAGTASEAALEPSQDSTS